MAKKIPTLNLPSADDLFSTQDERDVANRERVLDIPLDNIDAFPDHPFQVKLDESMQLMVDSIKAVGIQTPAVVRLKDDGLYELVSGHRRKFACGLAELEFMPCIVRVMSQDEAIIAMIDSNLQRELILPSEKARSYKMRLEAMKRQGQRKDLTSSPLGIKSKGKQSLDELGETVGESRNQIHRYIRLTELIPQLLDMVDNNQIAMRPAVELSYLTQEQQWALLETVESEENTPSHIQAAKLRKFSEDGRLDSNVILSILQEEKPSQPEHFKLPKDKIRRFFSTDTSAEVIEETIVKALELWRDKSKSEEGL